MSDPLNDAKAHPRQYCKPDQPLRGPVNGYAAQMATAYALVDIAESLRMLAHRIPQETQHA